MAGLKAITVNTPVEQEAHILAQDDAAIYQGIFGSDGVLNIGSKFKTTVINNNVVRVADGILCVGGHIARTLYADYQDMTIENGASGKYRNDIIYAKFATSGDHDTMTLEVKKGNSTNGTPQDPVMVKEDLYQGGILREYPLWRVKLSGLSITAVEPMYVVIPTVPELEKKVAQLSTDLSGAVSVKNFNITSNSIASGGYGTLSTNVSQNGYQPLGIIQIYSTNESSTLLQRYLISDNIAYVRIHNRSNAAIEVTFNICILYRKIL